MNKIWQELNRLRPYFNRQDKVGYVILLGLMIFGAILDVFGIGAIPAFIAIAAVPDEVMKYDTMVKIFDFLGLSPGPKLVTYGAIFLFIIYVLKNAFLFFVYQYQFKLVEHQRVKLAERLFRAYMYAPYIHIINRNTAELLRNVNSETSLVIQGVIIPCLNTLMGILMTLFTVGLLILAAPMIALVGVAILGIGSALFLQLVRKKLQQYGEIAKEERKEVVKSVNQGLGALAEARIFGRETYFEKILKTSLANFARVTRLQQVINRASPHIMETIAIAGILLVIVGLVLAGNEVAALLPTLALFGAATVRLKSTIGTVIAGISQIQYNLPTIDSIVADLELLEPMATQRLHQQKTQQSLGFKKNIDFLNVSFSYPNTNVPALKDISLTIPKGKSIGLVGATGSGKSTLINVILGLLEPNEGQVLVDGKDVFQLRQAWLNHIGFIPQTIYLTDDTIARNIAFGLPDDKIDYDQVWSAVRAAQLEDYIEELPLGIQTIVGERGVRMSGGQRQRVGIARALYNNPDVIIMDEATSSLDNKTESLVMNALEILKKGRTFIMIAHRLSTVQQCDRLYFLEHGEVVASGTYEELKDEHIAFRVLADLS